MLKITFLGHSSFKVENNDFSIIFDPYHDDSVPGLKYPKGQECNYLFISHEHQDHNAREYIKVNSKSGLKSSDYLVPHDKQNGTKRGMNRVRIVELDGIKIAHLGDICDIRNKEWVRPLNGVDIILCPINGFFTISSKEAKQLFDFVKPKLIIPMHYMDKENNSGYEDNDELETFMTLFDNLAFNETNSLEIEKLMESPTALIFKQYLQ